MQKTFYIIDDHEMLRIGTSSFIESKSDWKGCGNAGNGEDALADLDRLAREGTLPSVIICDLNFRDGVSGLNLVKRISEQYPGQKVIVYSMFFAPGTVQRAMASGASGYVTKDSPSDELLLCLEKVFAGERYLPQELHEGLEQFNSFADALTRREKEVLDLILRRMDNDEIAGELNLKKRVVDNYVSSIYDKTGINDRAELVKRFG